MSDLIDRPETHEKRTGTHACDSISKAMVCEILADIYPTDGEKVVDVKQIDKAYEAILQLPSAQPEIIRCRNCKFASGDSRICMKFGHSPIGELDFCAWAERRTDG